MGFQQIARRMPRIHGRIYMLRAPPTESFLMPRPVQQPAKARLGNPRVTGKEQFYTPPEVADRILRNVEKRIGNLSERVLLEPAGGTGAFIEAAKSHGLTKVMSFDIEPHHKKIALGDFLDQEIDKHGLLTITNPPFGRNNSLSIPFFNKAAQVSDLIVFIVPRSWRKWSVQNRLDQNFHLVRDDDLTINYVDVNGQDSNAKDRLRTCVQYWERKSKLRPIVKVKDMGIIERTTPELADAAMTLFGYNCGKLTTDFERRKVTTQMYLNFKHPRAKKAIENSDFSKFYMNTAYTEALSLPEINYVLNEYIYGDPMVQLLSY
jgi:predicted RNA methylase